MENDLFILGHTNVNILNNGENIFDRYNNMSKKKSNFDAVAKTHAQICSALGLSNL